LQQRRVILLIGIKKLQDKFLQLVLHALAIVVDRSVSGPRMRKGASVCNRWLDELGRKPISIMHIL